LNKAKQTRNIGRGTSRRFTEESTTRPANSSIFARDADVLVHCCYRASAEIENDHFRRVVQHTLAGGNTVGKFASRANATTLVLTHHRPRKDERMLNKLAEEVARRRR